MSSLLVPGVMMYASKLRLPCSFTSRTCTPLHPVYSLQSSHLTVNMLRFVPGQPGVFNQQQALILWQASFQPQDLVTKCHIYCITSKGAAFKTPRKQPQLWWAHLVCFRLLDDHPAIVCFCLALGLLIACAHVGVHLATCKGNKCLVIYSSLTLRALTPSGLRIIL